MKHSRTSTTASATQTLVNSLGWFSVGLGVLELFAPRQVAGPLGLETRSGLLRSYGLRELAAGFGILLSRRPAAWLWARAAGDVLDMATVAPQLTSRNESVQKATSVAALAIGAVAALDVYCAMKLAQQ
jgi:hypothetical protein